MASFAQETAHIKVYRPDHSTQSKADNETEKDYENERYYCKDEYIGPELDYATTTAISRYQIASERNNSGVEDGNKNSSLDA